MTFDSKTFIAKFPSKCKCGKEWNTGGSLKLKLTERRLEEIQSMYDKMSDDERRQIIQNQEDAEKWKKHGITGIAFDVNMNVAVTKDRFELYEESLRIVERLKKRIEVFSNEKELSKSAQFVLIELKEILQGDELTGGVREIKEKLW